jgi:plasmid maintenance system antidote protein VapI
LLRDKLLEYQRTQGLRDGEMARALGIPRTSYNALKLGQYGVSHRVALRIHKAFPALREIILMDDSREVADHAWAPAP